MIHFCKTLDQIDQPPDKEMARHILWLYRNNDVVNAPGLEAAIDHLIQVGAIVEDTDEVAEAPDAGDDTALLVAKVSLEHLYHLRCVNPDCKLWWSIADIHYSTGRMTWCPHCGTRQAFGQIEIPSPIPGVVYAA